jgi:hypothetical protein
MNLLNRYRIDSSVLRLKPLKLVLGVGAIVGVVVLGSTLAASINLNSGTPVEFGQGVAQTTACDDNVIVTPFSTFVNNEGEGDFLFTSITLSDISNACDGKIFTIKAFKNGTNSPLALYSTTGITDPFNEIQVLDTAGSFSLIDAGLLSDDISSTSGGFTVTFETAGPPVSTAIASAKDVDQITVESKDSASSVPAYYPYGPQENVLASTVTDGGWQLCWSGPYNGFAKFSVIQSQCTGKYLMYAGWAGISTDPETLPREIRLLAAAPRTAVFHVTASTKHLDATYSNGSGWYFGDDRNAESKGVGFGSATSMWDGRPCGDSVLGLCWHSAPNLVYWDPANAPSWGTEEPGLSPGWSLAGTNFLGQNPNDGVGANYTRAIFQHN